MKANLEPLKLRFRDSLNTGRIYCWSVCETARLVHLTNVLSVESDTYIKFPVCLFLMLITWEIIDDFLITTIFNTIVPVLCVPWAHWPIVSVSQFVTVIVERMNLPVRELVSLLVCAQFGCTVNSSSPWFISGKTIFVVQLIPFLTCDSQAPSRPMLLLNHSRGGRVDCIPPQ